MFYSKLTISVANYADIMIVNEAFPHVAEKLLPLMEARQTQQLITALQSYLLDERGGRAGFPEPVWMALYRIYDRLVALKQDKLPFTVGYVPPSRH